MTNYFLFALFRPAEKPLPPAASKAKRSQIADGNEQAVVDITGGGWKKKGDNDGKKSPKDEEKKGHNDRKKSPKDGEKKGKNGNAQKNENKKKKREKDTNGKKREVKRRKNDVDEDEDDEEEENMNDDFEKYLLQQDPSSKLDSSNLIKKMKKSQCEEKAVKSKMQKMMGDTIKDSAKGKKDAKQDLAGQDILAGVNEAENIKEDVEEDDPPEDDFEHPPHGYELEDNSEHHEEKDKQKEPKNEEEDVHETEKGASLSEVVDNTEKLEKYKVKKTEKFEDGTIVNIVKKVKFGEATDKSLQAVTEDANDDQKKEETRTSSEKNLRDRKNDRHDDGEQSGKSEEEDGKKLEKDEKKEKK